MKALDFIKEYAIKHDGFIAGSYCLNKLHNIAYGDIDYFTPLLTEALDLTSPYVTKELKVKDELVILDKKFNLKGKNYPKAFDFAAYECTDFEDTPVNLVMVLKTEKWFLEQTTNILLGFDLDILRVWSDRRDNFNTVHTTKYYDDCVKTKKIANIVRCKNYASWHDEARIKKYKERFPDFVFVKIESETIL